MPRINHDEIVAPGIPWIRLGELDQVHVCHGKIERGNQADNCHHQRFRHSALAHMMVPYRWLLGTSRQSVGALLVACPRTDSVSYTECITGAVCPWINNLVVSSAAQDVWH